MHSETDEEVRQTTLFNTQHKRLVTRVTILQTEHDDMMRLIADLRAEITRLRAASLGPKAESNTQEDITMPEQPTPKDRAARTVGLSPEERTP